MNEGELKNIWAGKYKIVPTQLEKVKKIQSVATAFNTNIDAIYKISGTRLKQLIKNSGLSLNELENPTINCFYKPEDVLVGIVKCFTRGYAEEWVTEDICVYNWLKQHLGYDRLQMGGQAGIIANALALLGVQKVIVHTNSHPEVQAKQFLDLDNLYGLNDEGNLAKASTISRSSDIPLIHWIIEFDKGDSFEIDGKIFTCPRSNRFIATYDPLNLNLVMNKGFVDYLSSNNVDYLLLSGFHALLKSHQGLSLIDNAVFVLKSWQKQNPNMLTHLEIASVQDKDIRTAIVEKIAPLAQSIGLNERETIDLLNVLNMQDLANLIEKDTNSCSLFDAILFLKKRLNIPRIQLHMFGLYITIQDKDFIITPEQTLNGMMTASVVSSSKAYNGEITKYNHLTKTLGLDISKQGLNELYSLSQKIGYEDLIKTGICQIENYWLCAVPTIIIDKPKTLVGMGDTISSVSLLATR